MNKKDIRYEITETIIKDSYLKILENNPNKIITVKELCFEANISRGTFYHHFQNVDEVHNKIAADFFKYIKEQVETVSVFNFDAAFLDDLFSFIKKEKVIFKLLIKDGIGSPLVNEIIKYGYTKFAEQYKNIFNIKDNYLKDLMGFILYGSISILLEWANQNFKRPIREISNSIYELNKVLIQNFI